MELMHTVKAKHESATKTPQIPAPDEGCDQPPQTNEECPAHPLLKMPPELHHMLINCASASTTINLKLSCKQLYECGPPLAILYDQVRNDPNLRFDLACIEERRVKRHHPKLACSGCRTFHLPHIFTEEQLGLEDWQRKCSGSQRRLRLAPDCTISYLELFDQPNRSKNGRFAFVGGWASKHHETPSRGTFFDFPWKYRVWCRIRTGKDYGPRRGAGGYCTEISQSWDIDIDALPPTSDPLSSLINWLAKHPVYFCPHTATHHHSIAALIRVMQEQAIASTRREFHTHYEHLTCPRCGTDILFMYRPGWFQDLDIPRGMGVIEMDFERRLATGTEFSALDADWIAQSEI